MKKQKIYWLLQMSGWALFAVINMIFANLQGQFNTNYFWYSALLAAWYVVSTHFFRFIIKKFNWLNTRIKRILPGILFSIAGLAIINFCIHISIWFLLGALNYEYDLDPTIIRIYILSSFVLYFIWALLYFIIHYIERYNAALKYEALKNEIELNNLKSQLNPHFIFNALNSIRALVDEDPVKSKDAITQLSNILRSSLLSNKSKLVSFNDEINAVQDYLKLEKMRFEERLSIFFEIDPEAGRFLVPPMMIQTLVENGIKHGISRLKKGGDIRLEARVENSKLNIRILNHGRLSSDNLNGSAGMGIANTIQRLKLLYGQNASFNIQNNGDNMVLTEVKLPLNL